MYLRLLVEYTECVPVQEATTGSLCKDRLIHFEIVQCSCWQIKMMTFGESLYIIVAVTEMDAA
jgi:hypothetical protein